MTLSECLERSDALRPNSASEAEKARWVLATESELREVFFPRYQGPPPVADSPCRWPEDGAKTLLGSGPYEAFYIYRLLACLDLMDQEAEQYNLHTVLANRLESDFKKDWHRRRRRAEGKKGGARRC